MNNIMEYQRLLHNNTMTSIKNRAINQNDKDKEFEKKVNPESVVWQSLETDYWKNFLKGLVIDHVNETGSDLSKRIIKNFDEEISNFVQVCPKEMIDKLKNPISLNLNIKEVS